MIRAISDWSGKICICFCVYFGYYYRGFISGGGGDWHWAQSPSNFYFRFFKNFLILSSLVTREAARIQYFLYWISSTAFLLVANRTYTKMLKSLQVFSWDFCTDLQRIYYTDHLDRVLIDQAHGVFTMKVERMRVASDYYTE